MRRYVELGQYDAVNCHRAAGLGVAMFTIFQRSLTAHLEHLSPHTYERASTRAHRYKIAFPIYTVSRTPYSDSVERPQHNLSTNPFFCFSSLSDAHTGRWLELPKSFGFVQKVCTDNQLSSILSNRATLVQERSLGISVCYKSVHTQVVPTKARRRKVCDIRKQRTAP